MVCDHAFSPRPVRVFSTQFLYPIPIVTLTTLVFPGNRYSRKASSAFKVSPARYNLPVPGGSPALLTRTSIGRMFGSSRPSIRGDLGIRGLHRAFVKSTRCLVGFLSPCHTSPPLEAGAVEDVVLVCASIVVAVRGGGIRFALSVAICSSASRCLSLASATLRMWFW